MRRERVANRLGAVGLAGLAVIALAASAATAIAQSARPETPYLSIAIAEASASTDAGVHLRLQVDNARDEALSARLVVLSAAPAGAASSAGTELWSGDLTAEARQAGPVELEIPRACGQRLVLVLQGESVERRLSTLVPCGPGARSPSPAPSGS